MNGKCNASSSAENNGLKNSIIFFLSVPVENTGTITLSSVHICVSGDTLRLVSPTVMRGKMALVGGWSGRGRDESRPYRTVI